MITGLDFIALPARDLGGLRKFYEDTLGFPHAPHDGSPWTEFDLGPGPALALMDNEKLGLSADPVTTGIVLIATQDLEGTLARFKAQGLAAPDATPFESPVCHGAVVRDAHGNALMLHRRKAEPGADNTIDAVVLPAADVKALAAWYQDALGLDQVSLEAEGWTEFVLPDGAAFALGDPRRMGIQPDPVTTGAIALRTPDLEAVFERFKEKGLASQPELVDSPVCQMGIVRDLAGNALILHRPK